MREKLNEIYRILAGKINSNYLINKYARKYRTDKINEHHFFAGKNFLDIYDIYFRQLRKKKITMLEIGIRDGASLRTFRDYFRNGYLVGLDINPECSFFETRIETFIGSQSSSEVIDKIFAIHPEIDIVLDDGSHVNELTLSSYRLIFDKLKPGGFYIIEDMACTYLEENLASDIVRGNWPGMHLNDPALQMVNKRSDMDTFFQKLIKEMDFKKGDIEFIHFWSQICIIKKRV